MATVVVDGSSV